MKFTAICINDENEITNIDLIEINDMPGTFDEAPEYVKDSLRKSVEKASETNIVILTDINSKKLEELLAKITDQNTQKIVYDEDDDTLEILDLSDFSTFEHLDTNE